VLRRFRTPGSTVSAMANERNLDDYTIRPLAPTPGTPSPPSAAAQRRVRRLLVHLVPHVPCRKEYTAEGNRALKKRLVERDAPTPRW
jgi:hypothetical protein